MADAQIDDMLRDGPYVIPFADPAPILIMDVSRRLAGVWLYQSRLMVDQENVNIVKPHQNYAMQILTKIHAGQINLSASRHSDVTYPEIVTDNDS